MKGPEVRSRPARAGIRNSTNVVGLAELLDRAHGRGCKLQGVKRRARQGSGRCFVELFASKRAYVYVHVCETLGSGTTVPWARSDDNTMRL